VADRVLGDNVSTSEQDRSQNSSRLFRRLDGRKPLARDAAVARGGAGSRAPRVYLVDKPNAAQSRFRALRGQPGKPSRTGRTRTFTMRCSCSTPR